MSHHWLLLSFTWFGPVSLQYINTAGPSELTDSSLHYPLPYTYYFNQPTNLETFQNGAQNDFLREEETLRKRRTTNDQDIKTWQPLVDKDKTLYIKTEEALAPYIVVNDENKTDIDKKNFSPWGGKRDGSATFEHMWSWKRSSGIREPSMPKRVRFSPWGGKRNGQVIYKPGSKGSKIIFSSSIPELTRIVSNYSPGSKRFNMAGIHYIPGIKRNPIKILAMSTSVDAKSLRDALPFANYMDNVPKFFKPGHPYNDVNLKKDGKRKMKFSIWGGKRAPPIIGPIWTPTAQDLQDSNVETIVLLRNKEHNDNVVQIPVTGTK